MKLSKIFLAIIVFAILGIFLFGYNIIAYSETRELEPTTTTSSNTYRPVPIAKGSITVSLLDKNYHVVQKWTLPMSITYQGKEVKYLKIEYNIQSNINDTYELIVEIKTGITSSEKPSPEFMKQKIRIPLSGSQRGGKIVKIEDILPIPSRGHGRYIEPMPISIVSTSYTLWITAKIVYNGHVLANTTTPIQFMLKYVPDTNEVIAL